MARFNNLKDQFGMPLDEQDPTSVINQSPENRMANIDAKQADDMDSLAMKYDTGNNVTPMSLMDQFTGAPTRAGVSELQKGLGSDNFKSAYEKALESMGQDPQLAPTGLDIAKGTGVDPKSVGGKALGVGYDLALDPTNLIPSKGGMAAIGSIGKMKKGAETVKDIERFRGVLGNNMTREVSKIGNVPLNASSTQDAVREMNKIKSEFGGVVHTGDLKKANDPKLKSLETDAEITAKIQNALRKGATPEQIVESLKRKNKL